MNDAGSPYTPSGTPPSPSGNGAGAPTLPSAMRLLSSVKKAFDASRDAPPSAARVLKASTSCKGFQGKHRTRRWCCRLTAVLDVLVDRCLVPDGVVAPLETHAALFFLLAPEMAWLDRLRTRGTPSSARAHLRHLAVDAALRLGMLLGRSGEDVASPLLEADPAWADVARRGELLRSLIRTAGFQTQKTFCDATGFEEDTVTGWVRHGNRPTPDSVDRLSGILSRRIPGTSKAALLRLLASHYALSSIADEVGRAFGRDFTLELGRVFAAMTSQGAANVRAGRASGQIEDGLAAAAMFHSLRTAPGVHAPVRLLRHVGASEEFVADVEAAHAAWQSVVKPVRKAGRRADLLVLVADMPRLGKGERRKRRPVRRGRARPRFR